MSDIWWADVIRAHRTIGGQQRIDEIAELLGFGDHSVEVPPQLPQPEETDTSQPMAGPDGDPTGAQTAERPGRSANLTVLEPIDEDLPPLPGLSSGPTLAPPGQQQVPAGAVPLPLLAPASMTAILHRLLSRKSWDGAPAIEDLLHALTLCQPPTAARGSLTRTLRFGTQVLVDLGDGLEPFRHDQRQTVDAVMRVAGTMTKVLYFADTPLRGAGIGGRWTWEGYEPPPGGTTVLLLSDLGIGGDPHAPQRASIADWRAFLDLLHDRGCVPVALVPYPAARWPAPLRERCGMLRWDRGTTVGHAAAVP